MKIERRNATLSRERIDMRIIEEFKKSDIDTRIGIMAWVFFIGLIILLPLIVAILNNIKQLDIDEEKSRCENYVMEMAVSKGQEGYCELYFDSNKDLHYSYVEVLENGEYKYRWVYMDWKTMKEKK